MQRIILADDHELIRHAVRPYLQGLGDDILIVEAGSYAEVLDACAAACADKSKILLALLDLKMPGAMEDDVFGGLRNVKRAIPDTPIVIFSASEDIEIAVGSIQNGASGYIPKTIRSRSILSVLQLVLAGEIYLPPSLMTAGRERLNSPSTKSVELRSREQEALRMMARGLSNKAIARVMEIEVVTVKLHLRNAYRKIGATNRIEAARIAFERGLV